MLDFTCMGSAELRETEAGEHFKMKIYVSTGNRATDLSPFQDHEDGALDQWATLTFDELSLNLLNYLGIFMKSTRLEIHTCIPK